MQIARDMEIDTGYTEMSDSGRMSYVGMCGSYRYAREQLEWERVKFRVDTTLVLLTETHLLVHTYFAVQIALLAHS